MAGDGKELFYLAPDLRLMAVPITAGSAIEAGTPRVLFETDAFPPSPCSSPLIRRNPVAAESDLPPITVVVNWQAALGR